MTRPNPRKTRSRGVASLGSQNKDGLRSATLSPSTKNTRCFQEIGTVRKSHSSRLGVSLTRWQGETKIELYEKTALISDCFFRAGVGVTVPITAADQLADLIRQAKVLAKSMRLLSDGGKP